MSATLNHNLYAISMYITAKNISEKNPLFAVSINHEVFRTDSLNEVVDIIFNNLIAGQNIDTLRELFWSG